MVMFLLRLAIVLFIIALFFPSTREEKEEVYHSVSSAAEQVQTFCVRNEALCDNVGTFVTAVANRVYIGAQIVYETAIGEPDAEPRWDRERPYPSRLDGTSRRERYDRRGAEQSSNTLHGDDLAPEWRGPGT